MIDRLLRLTLAVLLMTAAAGAQAREWRVAPGELQELLKSDRLSGGDRVVLQPGDHGPLHIKDRRYDPPIEIAAAEPGAARVDHIRIHGGRNIVVRDLRVGPDPEVSRQEHAPLAHVAGASSGIVLEGLDLRGGDDPERWTAEEWMAEAPWVGLWLRAGGNVARGNRISGMRYALMASGSGNVIEDNLIDGFWEDGIRVLGDDTIVRGNEIVNCYQVSDSHHDGIQSWSVGPDGKPGSGVIRGVVLSGNRIINWTKSEDHPLRCDGRFQGIGLHDGVYEDWLIENNLVATDNWNGIVVRGGKGVRIVNNTVVNPEGVPRDRPWIMLRPNKNGRSYDGNVVANNLAFRFELPDDVVDSANLRIRNPARRFVAPKAHDYRLKPDGLVRGAADPRWQPERDLEGRPRPSEGGDLGAFQR